MDFDRGQVRVTTLPAHRLMWLAAREGDAPAVGEALFRAHFAEGRNLADAQTLVDPRAAGGLSPVPNRPFLDTHEGQAELRAPQGQAHALGIRAVPTFVIDGRYAIQGGQAPELFAQALRQAMADQTPAPASGDACGPDGCTV
jgi:predicted DsbA family dithiol-disulfide isomerase